MFSIFSITLPFFALVFMGYVATRTRRLSTLAIPGLNSYVLYFALPCMLFRFGASTPIAQLLDPFVFMVYLPCALVLVAATVALTLSHKTNWNNAAFGALVAAFPNTGYMGVPLLFALFGSQVVGPTIITIVIDFLFTSSLCVALSRLGSAGDSAAGSALKQALKGMVINPMPWAIVLGMVFSALGVELLGAAAKTVELLALSASPVALFTIGAVLARPQVQALQARHATQSQPQHQSPPQSQSQSQSLHPVQVQHVLEHPLASQAISSHGRHAVHAGRKPTRLSDEWVVALLKLFFHPALVFLVGTGMMALGLPLEPFALKVIVLVAALPSASNVALLAERFEADSARIARIILISTSVAFFSFSTAVAWLS